MISIIIPVFNGGLLLERCLNSIFNQIGINDIEIIAIDDGSTDNTLAILERYKDKLIIVKQNNSGPASARNKGIEIATKQYLAFIDADDYWENDFLIKTINFLENNKNAVAVNVGQLHKVFTNNSIIPQKILDTVTSPFIIENFFEFWAEHNHICTGSVVIRTEMVKLTGGQRTDLRITEDLEFWGLVATYGKWGFIPEILFVSDGSIISKKIGWLRKNMKRWASAPSIEEWEKRIIHRISPEEINGFNSFKGKLARNLAYAMIQSYRYTLARKTIMESKNHFPQDKLSKLISYFTSKNILITFCFYFSLNLYEKVKAFLIKISG